ncbi:MAG TPA: hypothetical protein EYM93_03515 [Methylococcales bacterium]|nr:hypothetical protein [Methylococcales bacterium]
MDSKEEVETEERKDRTDDFLSLRGNKLDDFNYLDAIEDEILRTEEYLYFSMDKIFNSNQSQVKRFTDKTLSSTSLIIASHIDLYKTREPSNELRINDPHYLEKLKAIPGLEKANHEMSKLEEPLLSQAVLSLALTKVNFLSGNIVNALSCLSLANTSLGAVGFKNKTAKESELDSIHTRILSAEFGKEGGAKKNKHFKELRLQFVKAYQDGEWASKDSANEILYKRLKITEVEMSTSRRWLINVKSK